MTTPALPRTALVADPSRFGARVTGDVLVRFGIRRVVTVGSGAEAVTALADERPDLLVLDWDVPLVTAREILASARDKARSHAPGMPVIVTMAEPNRSAVEAALALRADTILALPFSPGELGRRLRHVLASRGESRAAA